MDVLVSLHLDFFDLGDLLVGGQVSKGDKESIKGDDTFQEYVDSSVFVVWQEDSEHNREDQIQNEDQVANTDRFLTLDEGLPPQEDPDVIHY